MITKKYITCTTYAEKDETHVYSILDRLLRLSRDIRFIIIGDIISFFCNIVIIPLGKEANLLYFICIFTGVYNFL